MSGLKMTSVFHKSVLTVVDISLIIVFVIGVLLSWEVIGMFVQ